MNGNPLYFNIRLNRGLTWRVLEVTMEPALCIVVPRCLTGCMYDRPSVMECDMHLW